MVIKVTQRHIDLGRSHDTSNTRCPVARALRAAGFKRARVGVEWAHGGNDKKLIILPKKVRSFIVDKLIRNSGAMRPFSFRLSDKAVKTLREK